MAIYYLILFLFLFLKCILSNTLNLEPNIPCDENSNSTLCHVKKNVSFVPCVDYKKNLLTSQEKNTITNFHNVLRENIVMGKEILPIAFYIKKIVWDEKLEQMAQNWAEKCTTEKDTTSKFQGEPIGQNIITTDGKSDQNVQRLIKTWADGLKYVTNNVISNYKKPKPGEYNYEATTQMIWWNSSLIGCGRSTYNFKNCSNGKNNSKNCSEKELTKLVCNYYPAGNSEEDPVYITQDTKNLPCHFNQAHVVCNNIASTNDSDKPRKNNDLRSRIRNRFEGIWPTAGRGTSINSNSLFILFILLKPFINIIMNFFNEMFNIFKPAY